MSAAKRGGQRAPALEALWVRAHAHVKPSLMGLHTVGKTGYSVNLAIGETETEAPRLLGSAFGLLTLIFFWGVGCLLLFCTIVVGPY